MRQAGEMPEENSEWLEDQEALPLNLDSADRFTWAVVSQAIAIARQSGRDLSQPVRIRLEFRVVQPNPNHPFTVCLRKGPCVSVSR